MANPDYKVRNTMGSEKKEQLRYNEQGKADKQIPVLAMPSAVIADASTAQKVGKGSLCRIHGTGTQYVVFGGASVAAPDVNTQTALLLNGIVLVVATDDYIRTSAAIRIEVIED